MGRASRGISFPPLKFRVASISSYLPTQAEHLAGLLSFPLQILLEHPVAEVRKAGFAHGLLRISYYSAWKNWLFSSFQSYLSQMVPCGL